MSIIKESKTIYEVTQDQIQALIAQDLGLSVDYIEIEYLINETLISCSPRKEVKIQVVVNK